MRKTTTIFIVLVTFLAGWFTPYRVVGSPEPPEAGLAEPIRCPDDYDPPPLEESITATSAAAGDGLKAVAIVGDVGGNTASYKDDMDDAVDALETQNVSVTKFYYGETSFTWSDVVAAAQGAHFLLYMGHGVYGWGGSNNWGGFCFEEGGEYVSPNQIRNDLDGVMASDNVVILSHVCFSAGSAGGDDPSQSEAEDRVHSYAEPFIDIGMDAYFANNYYGSATATVNSILGENTMENVFKNGVAYDPGGLADLSYPEPGYDLWLDKCLYNHVWNLSFVGKPSYVFQSQSSPCHWADFVGDCNGVDVADIQAVAGAWRCLDGEPCYEGQYDVDGDGVVTIVDIMAVAAEWGQS